MSLKAFVTIAAVLFAYCNASTLPEASDTVPKPQDPATLPKPQDSTTLPEPLTTANQAQCGGGCVNTAQCGGGNCRCAWFGCSLSTTAAELTDVQLFENFIKNYGGNAAMISSAEKAYLKKEEATTLAKPQNDDRAACGGSCVTSSQCGAYGGSNCRCAWFGCSLYTADADLTNVQQFEIFIKDYSGNAAMISSAEKAYQKKQEATTLAKPQNDQNDERASCGGGCVTSSQCAVYAGTTNCRCAWFGCSLYTADADLTDVQQFEIFIKNYSGNVAMISSAEKAHQKRQ